MAKRILICVLLIAMGSTQVPAQVPLASSWSHTSKHDHVLNNPDSAVAFTDTTLMAAVRTRAGREQLSNDAFASVLSALVNCAPNVAIGELLGLQPYTEKKRWISDFLEKDGDSYRVDLTDSDCIWHFSNDDVRHFEIKICLEYMAVQREDSVLASILTEHSYQSYPKEGCVDMSGEYWCEGTAEEDDCWCDGMYDPIQYRRVYEGEVRERFGVTIQVFPLLFNSTAYYMPSEVRSPEGPWARSLFEGMQYILLHELGHLEGEVIKENRFKKFEGGMGLEEWDCDAFASSVWRCVK